ncbi:unnamed protein product [Didymodactylos carnosus]|uniref:Uncharacterized protein n=1 Tax=Didymodactylos carnosus TaxID=1234261 RepID=A0A8S2XXN2_9BILA|nr:unnamed protein product [Didymodactylos carnosus]CAF4521689.1 unnamed protein product [Didymodactylos carnosus]
MYTYAIRQQASTFTPALAEKESRQFCHNQPSTVDKRWGPKPLDGPISIDFISQMLEARKVKSYPYSNKIRNKIITLCRTSYRKNLMK